MNEFEERLRKLTPREREALIFIGKGYTAKAVAENMGCTKCTVEGFLDSVRKRLDMTTIEAVVIATKAGWL
jgi:FixJ family two-component response regulator